MKQYDWVDVFHNGFARVKLYNKFGIIDLNYIEITEIKYDWCYIYTNGFNFVKLNDKYVFINEQGK
jgi:hypothetical protein